MYFFRTVVRLGSLLRLPSHADCGTLGHSHVATNLKYPLTLLAGVSLTPVARVRMAHS